MRNPAVMDEDKFNRMTVPVFSTKWAIVLCVCNFLVPGLGTCLAGLSLCCPCSDNPSFGCADCCCSAWLQFGVATLQLLLTPLCLLGWVWSCIWGCAFIGRSNPEWRARQQATQMNQHDALMSLVTEQPISASTAGGGGFFGRGFLPFADPARSAGGYPGRFWRPLRGHRQDFEYGQLPPAYATDPPPPTYEEAVATDGATEQRELTTITNQPAQS